MFWVHVMGLGFGFRFWT